MTQPQERMEFAEDFHKIFISNPRVEVADWFRVSPRTINNWLAKGIPIDRYPEWVAFRRMRAKAVRGA